MAIPKHLKEHAIPKFVPTTKKMELITRKQTEEELSANNYWSIFNDHLRILLTHFRN